MSLAFEKYFLIHHKILPFPRRRKKMFVKRRQLFATAEKVWSLSSMQRKSSSSQNRKHSCTHTLTHTHTGRLLYPHYSPMAARVMTDGQPKCLALAHVLHAARPIIRGDHPGNQASKCSTFHGARSGSPQ